MCIRSCSCQLGSGNIRTTPRIVDILASLRTIVGYIHGHRAVISSTIWLFVPNGSACAPAQASNEGIKHVRHLRESASQWPKGKSDTAYFFLRVRCPLLLLLLLFIVGVGARWRSTPI